MIKRENDSRAEQPRLVEQPAGERDEFGVRRIDRLGEHGGRPGPGRVRQPEPGPPVGAVITQHHLDLADHGIGMMTAERVRHPGRGDLVPVAGDGQLRKCHVADAYFRQLPPSTGSVTPVM